ncbi:AAA family ATPase [Streptomyces sp. NPDC001508]|uniref:ATP-binding protein n=1 Tax=Streptomyces sp. NPDC001508 TaxID=3154656 RepID=UPI003325EBCF
MYPFTAILGQDELKQALLLNAVDPRVSGLLALGDRGTAKSTTVRSLGALLELTGITAPVIDLPLGATEDRVVGSLDLDVALTQGRREFAPGLLAEAHGGFLYVDEVNLLDDYLVDLLLDVAASGVNHVQRDGLSVRHEADFVLVGSGNPEEGDLRPQLEDRFGLSTHVRTIADPQVRSEIVRRRLAFDADPSGFTARYMDTQHDLAERIRLARKHVDDIELPEQVLDKAVQICIASGAVGHRAEVVLVRAARAHAAFRTYQIGNEEGARQVTEGDLRVVAPLSLRHRVQREPFDDPGTIDTRLGHVIDAVLT